MKDIDFNSEIGEYSNVDFATLVKTKNYIEFIKSKYNFIKIENNFNYLDNFIYEKYYS